MMIYLHTFPVLSSLSAPQVKCLLDMMEQVMISETSKYLSKLHHLMLNERERDDVTLPLDLWKSNVSLYLITTH